jgi:hypothetical protein
MLQIAGIGGLLSFSGINITVSIIGIGAFISTITIIVYTLKQILESVVGIQLYDNARFFADYLFKELKAFYNMIANYFKPTSGLELENE